MLGYYRMDSTNNSLINIICASLTPIFDFLYRAICSMLETDPYRRVIDTEATE